MNSPLEELAGLYVLDQLTPEERADFEARLRVDPRAADLVRELESALEHEVRSLPQRPPPPGLWSKIETESGAHARETGNQPGRRPVVTWLPIARWGVAAVIALSLAVLAIQSLRRGPAAANRTDVVMVRLDANQSTRSELALPGNSPDADTRFIQLASLAEKYWEKPAASSTTPGAVSQNDRGYAVFDSRSNQGFIAIEQLAPAAAGKNYHLWILDAASGQAREAGILPRGGAGRGLYFFSVPPSGKAAGRMDFLVTAEEISAPDSKQPRGPVVLGEKSF